MNSELLSHFPKIRTELPDAYQKIYAEHYQANRSGATPVSSITSRLESWMHRQVAASQKTHQGATLEIGAGNLNHLGYETPNRAYDVIEPARFLYQDSDRITAVRKFYSDIYQIPEESKYSRIISIASFEHILDLPRVVAQSCMLLEKNGVLDFAIPSEGELMWKLGWSLTTGIEFKRKYSLDYGVLMRYEHVNSAKEIEQLVKLFFRNVAVRFFGVSRMFSFYQHIHCTDAKMSRAQEYLNLIKSI